jgi:hypothetical protein
MKSGTRWPSEALTPVTGTRTAWPLVFFELRAHKGDEERRFDGEEMPPCRLHASLERFSHLESLGNAFPAHGLEDAVAAFRTARCRSISLGRPSTLVSLLVMPLIVNILISIESDS